MKAYTVTGVFPDGRHYTALLQDNTADEARECVQLLHPDLDIDTVEEGENYGASNTGRQDQS